ncbi:MAG: chorismate synthase [Firmicutes bacterium]|nr:chorismate synthase [Bacillota bacterium]
MRYLTAGESHGPALITVVEGLPAGLPLTAAYVDLHLARRQRGYGRGGRMAVERDRVRILAGVRAGKTLGSPVALVIENRDWSNWSTVMAAGAEADVAARAVTRPRPGHADLAGAVKYRHTDLRNVLERASARETAARVAAGACARRLLEELGVRVAGQVTAIGSVRAAAAELSPDELLELVESSPVGCADAGASEAMVAAIDRAAAEGDTLGGVLEVRVWGLPPGLGSFAHWDRRLDGRLAGAVMSIPGIKGVEIGLGFAAAALPGSRVHDEIFYHPDRGFFRATNRAGGLEGGVTNGETLVVRAAMKPIPTLKKALRSVDLLTREPATAAYERADVCAVPAACVIAEAAVAWEVARAVLEKCGGDTLEEIGERWRAYRDHCRRFPAGESGGGP